MHRDDAAFGRTRSSLAIDASGPTAALASARRRIVVLACVAATIGVGSSASAESSVPKIDVQSAWLRATVPGQNGTGGAMTVTANADVDLIGARTDAAATVELHEMRMDEQNTMRMRAVERLPLPSGKPVRLDADGHHLMVMGLKKPLRAGERVPVVLRFRTRDGQPFERRFEFTVRPLGER